MDKTAQKRRGILHKLKENLDPFGKATEAFSPTFRTLMEELRTADDEIRDALLKSDFRVKDVLKSARSNFGKREYMASISDLTRFHSKIGEVVAILKGLSRSVDAAHDEFIYSEVTPDTLSGLKSLKEKFETKASVKKEAGLSDLWGLLSSERSKALKTWEKKYPTKMRQLKVETQSLISKSEQLFAILIGSLDDMSSARADRNLDHYLKASDKLVSKYDIYNNEFKKYYESNVKNFLEKLIAKEEASAKAEQELKDAKKVTTPEAGLGNQELGPRSISPGSSFSPAPGSQNYGPASSKLELMEEPRSSRPSSPGSSFSPSPGSSYGPVSSNPIADTERNSSRPVTKGNPSKAPTVFPSERSQTFPSPAARNVPDTLVDPDPNAAYEQVMHGRIPQAGIPRELKQQHTIPGVAPQANPESGVENIGLSKTMPAKYNKFNPALKVVSNKSHKDTLPSPELNEEDLRINELYNQVQHGRIPQSNVPEDFDLEPEASSDFEDTDVSTKTMPVRYNHFVSTLEVLSNESPTMLALEISKFASTIKDSDPTTSLKLLTIVESIVNGK